MSEPRTEHLTAEQRAALEAELAELEGPRRLDRLDCRLAARSLELGELGLEGGPLLRGQVLGSRLAHWRRA